jgi:hypothetical protein
MVSGMAATNSAVAAISVLYPDGVGGRLPELAVAHPMTTAAMMGRPAINEVRMGCLPVI